MLGLVLGLAGLPYKLAVTATASAVSGIRYGTKGEKKSYKIFNIMALLPMVMAIGVFLFAIISFTAGSGFADEIAMVKSEGVGAINDIWTSGTSGYFYNIWVSVPVAAILLVLAVKAVIRLYKNASVVKKTFFTIFLVLINIGAFLTCFGIINEVGLADAAEMIGIDGDLSFPIAAIMGIVAAICSIVCSFMLVDEEAFISGFINTVFYFTIAPLTCLIVENLIGLIVFAVVIVILLVTGNIFGASISPSVQSEAEIQAADTARRAMKEQRKKQDRIEILENRIRSYRELLEKHYKNELILDNVDPDSVNREIKKAQAELNSLYQSI